MNAMMKCPQCGSDQLKPYKPGIAGGSKYQCQVCGYTGPVMQPRMIK